MTSTATTMRTHLRDHVAPGPQAILFPALRGSGYARDTALRRLLTAAQAAAGIEIPDGHSGGWHALRHQVWPGGCHDARPDGTVRLV